MHNTTYTKNMHEHSKQIIIKQALNYFPTLDAIATTALYLKHKKRNNNATQLYNERTTAVKEK